MLLLLPLLIIIIIIIKIIKIITIIISVPIFQNIMGILQNVGKCICLCIFQLGSILK